MDENHLGDIINFLNSNKEAINTEWGYEYVRTHCKAIIAKEDKRHKSNVQMMPYNDLLITENDDKNKAYSCCLECSLGFIDYTKQPDNNYKHVLVYQDDVTKFTILKPLKEKERGEISQSLLEIFSIIGVPAKIYTCEKPLVKSVFNKGIRNFCQNFSTKIKQLKNGTFEETECCRIDKEIKEWMMSTMSNKWSQGLYFVQFQNNCYFNEAINAAPFYALLKPSYTYSRRKYTRYLFRKRDHDETIDPFCLKHPVFISNREIEGTCHFFEKSSGQEMKEKIYSSLKGEDDGTKIFKNDFLASKDLDCGMEMLHLKLLENEYQPEIRGNACEPAKIMNLEHEREMDTLNEHYHCNDGQEVCDKNPVNKYEMIPGTYGSLNNECGQVKECYRVSENKRCRLNKLQNTLNRELSKEEKKNECEQNANQLEQIPEFVNVLENDCIEKIEPGKCYKNESNQECSLIEYLGNHCDSVNLCEEAFECYKNRKCKKKHEWLNMPQNSTYHVLRLDDDQKINVPMAKLKQDDNSLELGKFLYKKHDVYDYEDTCPMKLGNNVPIRNKNSKVCLKLIGGNSGMVGGYECVDNNHVSSKKTNLALQENNVKVNSVRFAHECRGKNHVCLICKKKKRHKAGINSLNNTRFAIGSTVRVRVPVTERLKGYPNYILATIIEEKDRMYKVATHRGILKEMFKRDQLRLCNTSVLNTGGPSTRKAAENSIAFKRICK